MRRTVPITAVPVMAMKVTMALSLWQLNQRPRKVKAILMAATMMVSMLLSQMPVVSSMLQSPRRVATKKARLQIQEGRETSERRVLMRMWMVEMRAVCPSPPMSRRLLRMLQRRLVVPMHPQ